MTRTENSGMSFWSIIFIQTVKFLRSFQNLTYSVFKLLTGFANAALIALKLSVINAINNAQTAASANIHQ